MYSTDEVIAAMDVDITRFTWALNESPAEYAAALHNKALRCGWFSDEYMWKQIFIYGNPESIVHNMRSHWSSKKVLSVQDLGRHAILLSKHQHRLYSTERVLNIDKWESRLKNSKRRNISANEILR